MRGGSGAWGGVGMRPSVAELSAAGSGAWPAGERRAAHTLIASYPLIGLKTVADFSQQAGVSSPTILRFVGRLGFQNYPEFQSALQRDLMALIGQFNRSGDGSVVVPSEYLEVVITRH